MIILRQGPHLHLHHRAIHLHFYLHHQAIHLHLHHQAIHLHLHHQDILLRHLRLAIKATSMMTTLLRLRLRLPPRITAKMIVLVVLHFSRDVWLHYVAAVYWKSASFSRSGTICDDTLCAC